MEWSSGIATQYFRKGEIEMKKSEKQEEASRPYQIPQLRIFGHIDALTQGTGSKNIDAVAGRRKN